MRYEESRDRVAAEQTTLNAEPAPAGTTCFVSTHHPRWLNPVLQYADTRIKLKAHHIRTAADCRKNTRFMKRHHKTFASCRIKFITQRHICCPKAGPSETPLVPPSFKDCSSVKGLAQAA
jgi:hypothetical protein